MCEFMVFTAPLPAEIKLHGVGLAAQRLGTYRRYHKSPSPKKLLAPNTFSCHWLQKRNSSLCFLLLHNLACKSVCLSLAQVIYMILTSVPGFLREYCSENRMIPTAFPHCLLTPFPAQATAVQGSLAAAFLLLFGLP